VADPSGEELTMGSTDLKTENIQRMFASFFSKTPKTISLAEWLGREPTEAEKIEVAALNQNSSDNEYFSKLMKMKAGI
jgi:GTP cyclohydrolase III